MTWNWKWGLSCWGPIGHALALSAACVVMASAGTQAQVTVGGTVVNDVDNAAIEGAIVTVQGSAVRTSTDASGAFTLSGVDAGMPVIVGAARGWFNEAVTVTAPSTGVEIRLRTGRSARGRGAGRRARSRRFRRGRCAAPLSNRAR